MRSQPVWLAVATAALVLVAARAGALPAKEYRVQESTRCSYGQGCPRMLRNAVSHAEQFCQAEGGVLLGGNRRDFRCEQRGIYCVVTGRIECRGRLDPTHVPAPAGVDLPEPSQQARTCFDSGCNRFVSHAPGDQEQGTHACPFGYLVVGVSAIGNDLVCQEFPKPVRETRVEREERRSGLLACPRGMAVRGVDEARDALLCAKLDADFGDESVQDERDNRGLQVCDEPEPDEGPARFVTGLDAERTRLMCAPVVPH